MKYNIKANKKLFNDWAKLMLNLRDLKSIVQNDIELSEEALRSFIRFFKQHREKELSLFKETIKYIKSCGKPN